MNYYIDAIRNYTNFSGTASRQEFWMFVLFNLIINIVLGFLDNLLGLSLGNGAGLLSTLYSLFILVPSLSIAVRRMHDAGKSGAWILIALLPCVGWIWYIVLLCMPTGTYSDWR